jgi:hypothetical protein
MAKLARKDAELQVRALQAELAAKDDMLNKAKTAKYNYRTHNNISLISVTESCNEFGDGNTVVSKH